MTSLDPQTDPPRLYPAMVDLRGLDVLVVGGGWTAARKVSDLLASGARVRVVAPRIDERLRDLSKDNARLEILERIYRHEDTDSAWLAVAATDDAEVNRAVADRCRQARILCNVVDCPELCTVQVPAVLRRGQLQVAVSTGGASPLLARTLRDRLARLLGPRYQQAVEQLRQRREEARRRHPDNRDARRRDAHAALDDVLERFGLSDTGGVDRTDGGAP